MYTAMYLPVDKPRVEGCMLMNARGEVFEWDGIDVGWQSTCKVAELFIVSEEYNTRAVVGVPSTLALKWLKPGDQIKEPDAEIGYVDVSSGNPIFWALPLPDGMTTHRHLPPSAKLCVRIKCPTCRTEH